MAPLLQALLVVLCFITGFVLAGIIRSLPRFLPDVPNSRSLHSRIVPRGGGISFIIPFLFIMALNLLLSGRLEENSLLALLIGSALFSLLGLLDDSLHLSASSRLLLQFLLLIPLCIYGTPDRINILNLVEIEGWPTLILQVAWLLICINFYNFMDGLDGLAAGQAIFVSIAFGTLLYLDSRSAFNNSLYQEAGVYRIISHGFFCLAAAALGFLIWNLHPAALFMGDTGSYFLGFTFGFTGLIFPYSHDASFTKAAVYLPELKAPLPWADMTAMMLLLFPFLLDAGATVSRRLFEGTNILQAHSVHLYQKLYKRGFSPGKINRLFLGSNLLLLIPVALKTNAREISWFFIALAIICLTAGYYYFRESAITDRKLKENPRS